MAEIITYVDPDAEGGGTGVDWENAYTSLNAWNTAEATDLTSDTNTHICYCRSSGETADTGGNIIVTGWVVDATYFITVEIPDEYMHDGKRDATAYRIEGNQAWNEHLQFGENYTVIIGIQCRNTNASAYGSMRISGSDCEIKYCISYDNGGNATWSYGFEDGGDRNTFINCASLNAASDGFHRESGGTGSGDATQWYNCTSMGSGRHGFFLAQWRDANMKNCYAGGSVGNDIEAQANTTLNITTSYTEDGSESTTTAAYSTSAGAYFINVTGGSEDPHIGTSSSLKDNGTDLGADGWWYGDEDDIDRGARGVTWDIGADEFIAAVVGAGILMSLNHRKTMKNLLTR